MSATPRRRRRARVAGRRGRAATGRHRSLRVNGRVPRDVIEWRLWTDEADVGLDVARSGIELELDVHKPAGQPLGAEVSSAVFDRVRTCDNHCEFCFIYQLPKGLRRSLYLKDDDYRLSFLYGNFTTLTRFTEADLERVVTEAAVAAARQHPLDRSRSCGRSMLRNPRGATSLRWLRALLDHGIEVRGQLVVCPGVNDGRALDDTFAGILDQYPELSSVAVVPLGISRFNPEPNMRPHTPRRGGGGRRRGRGLAGRVPHRARSPDGARRRRVLPDGRPAVPGRRRLRGLHDARGRHRHGPHVRARVQRRVERADGDAARVLRRRRLGSLATQSGCLHRPAGAGTRPRPSLCVLAGRRRSASCRASSARGCWRRSSTRSTAATSA